MTTDDDDDIDQIGRDDGGRTIFWMKGKPWVFVSNHRLECRIVECQIVQGDDGYGHLVIPPLEPELTDAEYRAMGSDDISLSVPDGEDRPRRMKLVH